MEKYLDAAESVAAAVIDTRDFTKAFTQIFRADKMKSSIGGKVDENGFHVLASNGVLTATVPAHSDGKYKIRIRAAATQGGDENAKMALQIDGQNVQEFEVKGDQQPAWFEHDLTLTAGTHAIGGAFLNDYYKPDAPEGRRDRNLAIQSIEVIGPEGGGAPAWHETHRRFVTVRPSDDCHGQRCRRTGSASDSVPRLSSSGDRYRGHSFCGTGQQKRQ